MLANLFQVRGRQIIKSQQSSFCSECLGCRAITREQGAGAVGGQGGDAGTGASFVFGVHDALPSSGLIESSFQLINEVTFLLMIFMTLLNVKRWCLCQL